MVPSVVNEGVEEPLIDLELGIVGVVRVGRTG